MASVNEAGSATEQKPSASSESNSNSVQNAKDWIGYKPRRQLQKSKSFVWMGVLLLCCCVGLGGIPIAYSKYQSHTFETITQNRLREIGFASVMYESCYGRPAADSFDANGKPFLSWRVHLLPFLDQRELYQRFNLEEAWDSPTNKPLLRLMPVVFRSSKDSDLNKGFTYIRSFSSEGSIADALRKFDSTMEPQGPISIRKRFSSQQISDGIDRTIFAFESGEQIEWTKPDELTLQVGQPMPTFGGNRGTNDFYMITLEGFVKRVSKSMSPADLKALITIAGGEMFDFEANNGVFELKNLR